MTIAQTYSWIFYSIGLASQNDFAMIKNILNIADGLNHAVPTKIEIDSSISWLYSNELILKEGKKYRLSTKGLDLLENASSKVKNNRDVWKNIEKIFTKMGLDNIENKYINKNVIK